MDAGSDVPGAVLTPRHMEGGAPTDDGERADGRGERPARPSAAAS